MAILSNINGKFAVESTGAIQFNGSNGTSGYVLMSNGNASPTWVDPDTIIGPYLPLAGGTLTGATATASGISFTVGGVLTGTSATFSSNVDVTGSVISRANANYYSTRTYLGDTWEFASDTTDGVTFKITGGAANTTGNFFKFQTQAGGATAATALTINKDLSATFAGTVDIHATTGDSLLQFNIDGDTYSMGIDNSDSDKFKISYGVFSNSDILTLDTSLNATFAGDVTISRTGGNDAKLNLLTDGAGGSESLIYFSDTTDGAGRIRYDHNDGSPDEMSFYTASTKRFYINSSGNAIFTANIGIGGRTPDSSWGSDSDIIQFGAGDNDEGFIGWRAISGADELNMGWNCYNDNSDWKYDSGNPAGLYQQKNGSHTFYSAATGSADANITWQDGEIKIGGSASSLGLVIDYDQSSATVAKITSNPTYTNTGALMKLCVDGDANPDQLVLKGDGNVGIGTTSPSVRFQVQQDQAAESNVIFMNNSTSAGAAIRLTLNVGNPAGNDPMISFNIGDGGFDWTMGVDNSDSDKFKISGGTDSHNPNLGTNDRLTIDSSGNLTMSGDVVAYSDKKLKKNIKTLDGSKVYKMRGVSFDRIDTGKKSSGVIAQEIQKIAPELISESNETLGVAYGNLTGYLIEAIKELEARVKELENK